MSRERHAIENLALLQIEAQSALVEALRPYNDAINEMAATITGTNAESPIAKRLVLASYASICMHVMWDVIAANLKAGTSFRLERKLFVALMNQAIAQTAETRGASAEPEVPSRTEALH